MNESETVENFRDLEKRASAVGLDIEISSEEVYETLKSDLMAVLSDMEMHIGCMGGGSRELHLARTKLQEAIFWTIAHDSHNN